MNPNRFHAQWRAMTPYVVAFLLVLAVGAAFWPEVYGAFLNWDDNQNFLKNLAFRGLAMENLHWAFTARHLGVYQPLAWLALSFQYVWFGLEPFGYHCISLGFHLANTLLLFLLTSRLVALPGRTSPQKIPHLYPAAALATALVMAHPQRTEVIAWISCQPYLGAVLFALLSLHAYLSARESASRGRHLWFVAALMGYAASLLCKTIFIGLPLVLLLVDYYSWSKSGALRSRPQRRLWLEKVPFAALALIFAGFGLLARNTPSWDDIGGFARLHQILYRIGFFWEKSLIPIGLSPYVNADPFPPHLAWRIMGGIFCLLIFFLAFFLRNRSTLCSVLFFVGLATLFAMAPNLGIVMTGNVAAADRYTYLPALCITLLPASCLIHISRPWPWRFWLCTGTILVAALIILSREQCLVWRDSVALWSKADQIADHRNAEILYNLATAWELRSRTDEALSAYWTSLQNDPDYSPSHFNRGLLLAKQQRYAESLFHFSQAVRLTPKDPDAHEGQGDALSGINDASHAIDAYREALRLSPSHPRILRKLALALFQAGRREEAINQLDQILAKLPDAADIEALKRKMSR